jgi:hypothetical protein
MARMKRAEKESPVPLPKSQIFWGPSLSFHFGPVLAAFCPHLVREMKICTAQALRSALGKVPPSFPRGLGLVSHLGSFEQIWTFTISQTGSVWVPCALEGFLSRMDWLELMWTSAVRLRGSLDSVA